jgi:hypothetical protein
MKTTDFTEILKTPQQIGAKSTEELSSILEEYPFFQAARAVHLKGLKKSDSFKYNSELKVTAAYTTDRSILFDFITSKEFVQTTKKETIQEVHQQVTEKIISEKPEEIKEELQIGSPISFTKTETHSFNEWLQLSTYKKIDRKSDSKVDTKSKIIDDFIKLNPKISKVSKSSEPKDIVIKDQHDSSLMTETLAKVYLEQNKYENAIKAYEILSLKYPEKSGFFADQIKRIRILQKNKS